MGATEIPSFSDSLDLVQFIRANLPIVPVPSVPEIRLHKADPKSGLWRLAELNGQDLGPPYWAHHWGGGLALARYLLDHPETVAGSRVLDLGAGSGIVAIAAAKAGAREVTAADVDPFAIAVLGLNTAVNDVTISTILGDMMDGSPPAADLITVGDLFYERELAGKVMAFLDVCLNAGIKILVGDPWRAFLPVTKLRLLAEYGVKDFGEVDTAARPSAVFSFVGDGRKTSSM